MALHCCPKQPMRPGAARILLDIRCQKLQCKSQVARPRAAGAKDSSPGQAKRSPGLWRINHQAPEGRQAFLSPFQGLSVCQPDPGLRFACPGLLSFGPPGRLRKNLIWTRTGAVMDLVPQVEVAARGFFAHEWVPCSSLPASRAGRYHRSDFRDGNRRNAAGRGLQTQLPKRRRVKKEAFYRFVSLRLRSGLRSLIQDFPSDDRVSDHSRWDFLLRDT
jgi:hypothetical protein